MITIHFMANMPERFRAAVMTTEAWDQESRGKLVSENRGGLHGGNSCPHFVARDYIFCFFNARDRFVDLIWLKQSFSSSVTLINENTPYRMLSSLGSGMGKW